MISRRPFNGKILETYLYSFSYIISKNTRNEVKLDFSRSTLTSRQLGDRETQLIDALSWYFKSFY